MPLWTLSFPTSAPHQHMQGGTELQWVHLSARRQDSGSVTDEIGPGMATYTIPGISFTMPSSVGPLQFFPLFTSRHTAEVVWVWIIPSCLDVLLLYAVQLLPAGGLVVHYLHPVGCCLQHRFVIVTCSMSHATCSTPDATCNHMLETATCAVMA